MDIVDIEFERVTLNINHADENCNNHNTKIETRVQRLISSIPTSSSFWKPFGILTTFFTVGSAWTGFDVIAFYMVPLLQEFEIPFDPFWGSACLASYR